MRNVLRYSGQVLLYGVFIAAIGYFSVAPAYVHFPSDQALIKVSFSHAGQPLEECRPRTAEELAALPPNMRAPMICGRERSPVKFELDLNGRLLHRAELPPSGLARDGSSRVYLRFAVPAGSHRLNARLKDNFARSEIGPPQAGPELDSARGEPQGRGEHSVRATQFNYTGEAEISVKPGQVFVVDFNARAGGFVFK